MPNILSRLPASSAGSVLSALPAQTYFAGREDTADRAIESITTDRALTLIGSLPRDQAEAVLLRVVAGLDARGAARVAGKRTGAIRTAAYRGLKRLAKRLERSQPPAESR
jgi:DNA-directed RNA polymerase specialized sigma24 family protein